QLQRVDGGFGATVLSQESRLDSTYFAISTLTSLNIPLDRYVKATDYLLTFERIDGGFGNYPGDESTLRTTFDAILALNLIGKDPLDKPAVISFLNAYRRSDGGFGVGEVSDVESTYRAVFSLKLLSHPIENPNLIIEFLKSAQNLDGGFGWREGYTSRSANTYRAIYGLYLLGAEPTYKYEAINFLQYLQNPDGGFGNYLGEGDSDMGSTYRTINALALLEVNPRDPLSAINFIKESQNSDGGFKRSPNEVYPEDISLNIFTYDAVRALNILGEKPNDVQALNGYLDALRNPDFGFGTNIFFTSGVDTTFTAIYTLFLNNPTLFNNSPALSDYRIEPTEGYSNTTFTFYVNYTDMDKQLPTEIFLRLNDERISLEPLYPTDYAVSNGKIYYCSTKLPVDSYSY
ncbi:MAG: prenyltransferase/squalene oxidase repeat-containing protein, partial [Promethearchaeota archaeon]